MHAAGGSAKVDGDVRAFALTDARWLRGSFLATLLVLLSEAFYVFVIRLERLVHSDSACFVLMAQSAIDSRSPIPNRWYWGNGDVWWLASPLAAIPVALGGPGLEALRASEILTFVLELGIAAACYRLIERRTWLACFGSVAMLVGISRLHFLFAYVELGYGVIATMYFGVFALLSRGLRRDDDTEVGAWSAWSAWWAIPWMFCVAVGNPTRFFLCGVAPLLVAAVWPWRTVGLRMRIVYAALVAGTSALAFLVYRLIFERFLTFSPHVGHTRFAIADLAHIAVNLQRLGRGLLLLTGEQELSATSIPGLLLLLGALVLVSAEVFASRQLTRARFLGLVLLAQLGCLLGVVIIGPLLLDPTSVRYLMPAVLPLMGLAAVFAYRRVTSPSSTRVKRAAAGWLLLVPVAGALGFTRMIGVTIEGDDHQWANRAEHAELAKELVRRDLRHGFASYWNANLVTLFAKGRTTACPVFVGPAGVYPQKWNVDARCFEASALPSRVYFISSTDEQSLFDQALAWFPEPRERFRVGRRYEVLVFPTDGIPLGWLDVPLPPAKQLRFPLRLSAVDGTFLHAHATRQDEHLVGTGEPGTVVYGPYVALPKGKYRASWIGTGVDSPGTLDFDVASSAVASSAMGRLADSQMPAVSLPVRSHEVLATLSFELEEETPNLEFRVFSKDGARVMLDELRIERN